MPPLKRFAKRFLFRLAPLVGLLLFFGAGSAVQADTTVDAATVVVVSDEIKWTFTEVVHGDGASSGCDSDSSSDGSSNTSSNSSSTSDSGSLSNTSSNSSCSTSSNSSSNSST